MGKIKEDNRLIAEFMGLKPIKIYHGQYSMSLQPWVGVTGTSPEDVWRQIAGSLPYPENWDVLMPVLKKLLLNKSPMDSISILNSIETYCGQANIEGAYREIVNLIKWRNNQRAS